MWKRMKRKCRHCGGVLEARPAQQSGGIVISGFEPMEYRHQEGATKECWLRREAEPYDKVNAQDEWRNQG